MSKAEAGWPYQRIETLPEHGSAPTWRCPDDQCDCAAQQETEPDKLEFSVMLCKPDGERMPGARCRVVVNGILANPDTPNADGEGWVTAPVHRLPDSVLVEWAPADTPEGKELPYRRRYFVELRDDDPPESARRRLHNLGFSRFPSLRENIEDFQYEYGLPRITGELVDVMPALMLYHDEAMVPVVRDEPEQSHGGSHLQRVSLAPDQDDAGNNVAMPQPQPGSPPSSGGQPLGSGTVKSPRTIATSVLESVVDIIKRGDHQFRWWGISTFHKGLACTFWVFLDALKNKANGRRWPCSPAEAQEACDLITASPADLPGWEKPGNEPPLPSIFLTPKLNDERWAAADKLNEIIDPHSHSPNTAANFVQFHKDMNAEVDADMAKMKGAPWAADPGKLWVLTNNLFDNQGKLKTKGGLPAAANHGWHVHPSKIKNGAFGSLTVRATTMTNQFAVEIGDTGHNVAFIDYSQILILAAGYCQLYHPNGPAITLKTADVYTDPDLCGHVVPDNKPLKVNRQPVGDADVKKLAATRSAQQETMFRKGLIDRARQRQA